MTTFQCCFPMQHFRFKSKATTADSPASSAASENEDDDEYCRAPALPGNRFSSTLANQGSLGETASVCNSLRSMESVRGSGEVSDLGLAYEKTRRQVSDNHSTTGVTGRDGYDRERLLAEVVRLRRALELTENELSVTEAELRDTLIQLAQEKESVADDHQSVFKSFFSQVSHRRHSSGGRKHRRSGSCPMLALPPSQPEQAHNAVTFSTINALIT